MPNFILTVNPGSTSTKIGVFKEKEKVFEETIRHSANELMNFEKITDQLEFRKKLILKLFSKSGVELSSLTAVVGRGGLLKPMPGGTYVVNEVMKQDLINSPMGDHASNLGGLIADQIANEINVKAYIVDPVVVDEMEPLARYTGNKAFERKSIFHALNQKAVSKRYASEQSKDYNKLSLIVAHLGGGISVSAHKNGKVIDTNDALMGEGPFSPDRSGTLPTGDLTKFVIDNKTTWQDVKKMLNGEGGLFSYVGNNDMIKLGKDYEANLMPQKEIFEAMAYQVSKSIGTQATVLSGGVDQIILTGGIAYSKTFTKLVKNRVSFISPVTVYPGEDELEALAYGALSVLEGKEEVKIYN